MELTQREQRLIDILIQSEGFVSAESLAGSLKVSDKTIYRDIKHIESSLGTNEQLIIKIPGKGYKINYSLFIAQNEQYKDQSKNYGLSIDERRLQILTQLLTHSPQATSINQLAEMYFVSNTSIVNDLKIVEEYLEKTDLKLMRDNTGTYILGNEKDIRKRLMDIINTILSEKSHGIRLESKLDLMSHQFLKEHFSIEDINFVNCLMNEVESDLDFSLENPYYVNIFTHLLILIKRLKKGNVKIEANNIEEEDIDKKIYGASLKLVDEIEKYVEVSLPHDEARYIYGYLISAGGYTNEGKLTTDSNEFTLTKKLVTDLIKDVSLKIKIDFCNDTTLNAQLLQHFKPMLKRILYDVQIKNTLLPSIKIEFLDLFKAVKMSLNKTCERYHIPLLSDDEIGYIVIYFQNALEHEIQKKQVLIVCSTGIGTSHLLKTRVSRAFPKWNIIDVISSKNIKEYGFDVNIDVILTTVNIAKSAVPTVLVSALFNQKDIEKVMNEIYKKKDKEHGEYGYIKNH